jgi:hypothetical protein
MVTTYLGCSHRAIAQEDEEVDSGADVSKELAEVELNDDDNEKEDTSKKRKVSSHIIINPSSLHQSFARLSLSAARLEAIVF